MIVKVQHKQLCHPESLSLKYMVPPLSAALSRGCPAGCLACLQWRPSSQAAKERSLEDKLQNAKGVDISEPCAAAPEIGTARLHAEHNNALGDIDVSARHAHRSRIARNAQISPTAALKPNGYYFLVVTEVSLSVLAFGACLFQQAMSRQILASVDLQEQRHYFLYQEHGELCRVQKKP